MRNCAECIHGRTVGNRTWCDKLGVSTPEVYSGECAHFKKEVKGEKANR